MNKGQRPVVFEMTHGGRYICFPVLHAAAWGGSNDLVEKILKYNCDVNQQDASNPLARLFVLLTMAMTDDGMRCTPLGDLQWSHCGEQTEAIHVNR